MTRCPHCGSAAITWTRANLVAAAQRWAETHGRAPRPADWKKAAVDRPSVRTIYTRFDTWVAFLEAAGLERPSLFRRWTREEILQAVFEFRFQSGRLPEARDWTRSTPDFPSRSSVVTAFGSWNAMIVAAGYEPRSPRRSAKSYSVSAANKRRQKVAA